MDRGSWDVVVIGGGQAGIPLAFELAASGMAVALVERRHLGGSCVNFGCIPTKAALASASLAYHARRAGDLGLKIPAVEAELAAVLERAREVSAASRRGLQESFEGSENSRLVMGHARLGARHGDLFAIEVDDAVLEARQIVLDTGTRSVIPPIDGLDDTPSHLPRLDVRTSLLHRHPRHHAHPSNSVGSAAHRARFAARGFELMNSAPKEAKPHATM